MMMNTDAQTNPSQATGPKTAEGKRIAARNATTHGLFARDVVLPSLGEDPNAYQAFLDELTAQLKPKNLLQRHYTEKIAAASWRLRRLHRWQAQLFEDATLTDAQILAQLDSVLRHETTLHRQIDTSIKMMGRELPHLFETNAHKEALDHWAATDDYCARNPSTAFRVATHERELLEQHIAPPDLDLATLDTAPESSEICQNEPPVSEELPAPPELGAGRLLISEPSPRPLGEGRVRDSGQGGVLLTSPRSCRTIFPNPVEEMPKPGKAVKLFATG
jgi:hypothetical protein